jgi:hypothetical protein
MSTKHSKRIKYSEGQWFAVPLHNGGFALGILARANPRAKVGLGYFFGRRFSHLPTAEDTRELVSSDAILIARFGDLGIVEGKWPLVKGGKPFHRQDWPVPKFARIDLLNSERGVLVEYESDGSWTAQPIRETPSPASDLINLPLDGMFGSVAIEAKLTHLLTDDQSP